MTLVIPVSPDVESKLRERAAAEGEDPTRYAARLLAQAVARPSVEQLLAPFRKQVADSGMTDEQLDGFFRQQLDATRRQAKANPT
jgi:hypothetical protein